MTALLISRGITLISGQNYYYRASPLTCGSHIQGIDVVTTSLFSSGFALSVSLIGEGVLRTEPVMSIPVPSHVITEGDTRSLLFEVIPQSKYLYDTGFGIIVRVKAPLSAVGTTSGESGPSSSLADIYTTDKGQCTLIYR